MAESLITPEALRAAKCRQLAKSSSSPAPLSSEVPETSKAVSADGSLTKDVKPSSDVWATPFITSPAVLKQELSKVKLKDRPLISFLRMREDRPRTTLPFVALSRAELARRSNRAFGFLMTGVDEAASLASRG